MLTQVMGYEACLVAQHLVDKQIAPAYASVCFSCSIVITKMCLSADGLVSSFGNGKRSSHKDNGSPKGGNKMRYSRPDLPEVR